jgi:hypothetical protein
MKKVTRLAIACVLTLAASTAALAGGGTGRYEWRISFSNSDPYAQTGADFASFGNLYLWVIGCNSVPAGPGLASAEFDVVATGWTVVGFAPANGFLNAGGPSDPLLAVGGCPAGPVIAGSWTVLGTAGKMSLKESVRSSTCATVDCDGVTPQLWSWPDEMLVAGAISAGQAGIVNTWGNGCGADPVDASSWGSVKSLYR